MATAKITEKRWDKSFEKPVYARWKADKLFAFNKDAIKPFYSIDTPPPYVNTPIHIGHAVTYVLMDMFARYRRMTGHEVLFPLGLDRNGLPIEMAAERRFGKKLSEVSRAEFVKMCNQVLEESSAESTDSFLKLGISFNSWELGSGIGDMYYTDSDEYRTLTQETFIDLWNKGLIYEDERTNNYCPGCQTTIADSEIDYMDIPSLFNDVIFKIEETGEEIIIGTTRPELICSCAMVVFHPDDARYHHLEGKHAITPVFNKKVPIRAHPSASMEKGTGLVMMCSFGDYTDIRFFRDMNLEPIISINIDGKMNENAGQYNGLAVREAREKIIEDLRSAGLLVKQKEITHRTPVCERSKDEIEFISMKEYYLKQLDFLDDMKRVSNGLNFFAPKSKQILDAWIDSVKIDWPISRRRVYATEIPLWYCKSCNAKMVPEKGRYYRPWKDKAPFGRCRCGSSEFVPEMRVFDTWFDSSITPLYILGYGRDPEFFQRAKPCTLRPQGKEIIRTWLYYTLLKCYHLTGEKIFRDAWINYHIVDEKGTKMSKSLGNVIDPHDILEKFGAEPFRLWCAVEGNLDNSDLRCSYERIDGAGKTLTKLWNVTRFISMFEYDKTSEYKLTELDKWIISEVNELIDLCRKSYEVYDFHNPGIQLKHFIWDTLASHYLEMAKKRAYNDGGIFSKEEQNGALYTLDYCTKTLLRLLSPITPFITEKLYSSLFEGEIHHMPFPEVEHDVSSQVTNQDIIDINSAVWKAKEEHSISLKNPIKMVTLTEKYRPVEKELIITHNIEKVEYGDEIKVIAE
ncbi:valine--tRNA ligase [Candidatus Woesearchaeota archaeon]|nr:valine--tRNA ligase [Candidatus Woesearchaeota archaeon]